MRKRKNVTAGLFFLAVLGGSALFYIQNEATHALDKHAGIKNTQVSNAPEALAEPTSTSSGAAQQSAAPQNSGSDTSAVVSSVTGISPAPKGQAVPEIDCSVIQSGDWVAMPAGQGRDAQAEVNETAYGYHIVLKTPGFFLTHETVDSEIYTRIDAPGMQPMQDVGKPALPKKTFMLALPDGIEPVVHVAASDKALLQPMTVYPAQPPRPDVYPEPPPGPFQKDTAVYSAAATFPKSNLLGWSVARVRNRRILTVDVTPAQLMPDADSVLVAGELEITVTYNNTDSADSSGTPELLSEGFVNGEPSRYMILLNDAFLSNGKLSEFVEWKRRKGYEVVVTPTSVIDPIGRPDADEVVDYMRGLPPSEYPEYLLILGDHTPSRGVAATYFSTDEGAWTDLPMACRDESDFFPDLYYGRLPAFNQTALSNMLARTLLMDRDFPAGQGYNRSVFAGMIQDSDDYNNQADRFFCETLDCLACYFEQDPSGVGYDCSRAVVNPNGVSSTCRWDVVSLVWYSTDIIGTRVHNTFVTEATAQSRINGAINGGASIVVHRDHGYGSGTGWADPKYLVEDVYDLTNSAHAPVVFSINCASGAYHKDAFLQAWFQNLNGGAWAVFAPTDISYSGHNDWITYGFFASFLTNFISFQNTCTTPDWSKSLPQPGGAYGVSGSAPRLGEMLTFGKLYYAENYYEYDYVFEEHHLFGDPEAFIVASDPQVQSVAHATTMSLGAAKQLVLSSVAPGSDIALYQPADGYLLVTNSGASSSVTMTVKPTSTGALYVTVSKFGYRPYQGTVNVTGTFYVCESATVETSEDESQVGVVVRRFGSLNAGGVAYYTANGTALAGDDYTQASGTLSFGAGQSSNVIWISLNNDSDDEYLENFTLHLGAPNEGYGALGVCTSTVINLYDNDGAGQLCWATNAVSVYENADHIDLQIRRINGVNGSANVSAGTSSGSADAGYDYTGTNAVIYFADSQTGAVFQVKLIDDELLESSENFNVMLYNAHEAMLNSPTTINVTINEDHPDRAKVPFHEGFEDGDLQPYWSVYATSKGWGGCNSSEEPNSGTFHYTMASVENGPSSLNELILNIDLQGASSAVLSFYHKESGDEDQDIPDSFSGHAYGDGVSISQDGTTWYKVQGLLDADGISSTYTQFEVDIAAAASSNGLALNRDFKIKFQQYDNYRYGSDGFAFDDIDVTAVFADPVAPSVPANLQQVGSTYTTIDMSWAASTDNVAVAGYTVYRDGSVIDTTSGTTYQDTGRSEGASYQYQVAAYDAAGNTSAPCAQVQMSTDSDTTAPTIQSVSAVSATAVDIEFSENVAESTAETVSNYSINNGISVSAAVLQGDGNTVRLTVTTLTEGTTYTLTVNNVQDTASTPNTIASNSQDTFQYSGLGFIHHWKLDDGSGTTAIDSVGSNNGTVSGATWTTGNINGALDFSEDHVDLGGLDVTGSALTITAWIYPDTVTDWGRVISKAVGTAGSDHYWMISMTSPTTANRLRFRLKAGGTTAELIAGSGSITAGAWQHVAVTYDGANMKIYRNAVQVGSMAKTGVLDTSGSVNAWIGDNPVGGGGANAFDGKIDDVRIYNEALNAAAISNVMNYSEIQQVATPSISPNGGAYSGAVTVTLSCATSGADIYYTTDGSTPTTGEVLYSAPLMITSTMTLKAKAFKAGMTDSAVASAAFTVTQPDTEAPSVPTGLALVTNTSSAVDFNWVASTDNTGVAGYRVYRDGSQIEATAATNCLATGLSADTAYAFRVSAYDAAGNTSLWSSALVVTTATEQTGINLLQNPSFEEGTTWPTSWGTAGGLGGGTGERANDHAYDGSWSMKVSGNLFGARYSDQHVALQADTGYRISFRARCDGVTGNGIFVRYAQLMPTVIVYNTPHLAGTCDWTTVTMDFTTDVSYASGRLDIYYGEITGGTCWIDDVRLFQPGAEEPTWTLTASAGAHGSIWPTNAVVSNGGSTNFVITPDAYYFVTNLYVNGQAQSATTNYVWSDVTANGTITVAFAQALAVSNSTPHWWLAQYGLTNSGLTFDQAEGSDPDGDGMTAWQEYIAGCNPTSAASRFVLGQPEELAGGNRIVWAPIEGRIYDVYWSTNVAAEFQTLETGITWPQGSVTDETYGAQQRIYYRLKVSLDP